MKFLVSKWRWVLGTVGALMVSLYAAGVLLGLDIDLTKLGAAHTKLVVSKFSGSSPEKCKAAAKPVVDYEQREYDRWADNADYCLTLPRVQDRWEDPEILVRQSASRRPMR